MSEVKRQVVRDYADAEDLGWRRRLVESLVEIDARLLAEGGIPTLRDAGIRYAFMLDAEGLRDASAVIRLGCGSAEDLVAWRVATPSARSSDAQVEYVRQGPSGPRDPSIYSVQIRLPDGGVERPYEGLEGS